MKLEECIDKYIQGERKQELIKICLKLGEFADAESTYNYLKRKVINKILDTKSIDNILDVYIPKKEKWYDFEEEISNLVLGLSINNCDRLNDILEEWGFVYDGIIPDELVQYLFDKYKSKLRLSIENERKTNSYSLILKTVYTISIIYTYGNIKQVLDYDSLKNYAARLRIDEKTLNKILFLLIHKWNILNSKQYKLIELNTIHEWINEYGVVEFINDIYNYFWGRKDNYNEILSNMCKFEENREYWLKESYLKHRYGGKVLNDLWKLGIVEMMRFNNEVLLRRSDIGVILTDKRLPVSWKCSNEIIEIEDKIYLPHNINPFQVIEYFIKYELTDQSDYILIFKNKHNL